MWQAHQRALHYTDHIKMLSNKLSGVSGAATTLYPFHTESEWTLTFKLKMNGQMDTARDGLAFWLSPKTFNPETDLPSEADEATREMQDFIAPLEKVI